MSVALNALRGAYYEVPSNPGNVSLGYIAQALDEPFPGNFEAYPMYAAIVRGYLESALEEPDLPPQLVPLVQAAIASFPAQMASYSQSPSYGSWHSQASQASQGNPGAAAAGNAGGAAAAAPTAAVSQAGDPSLPAVNEENAGNQNANTQPVTGGRRKRKSMRRKTTKKSKRKVLNKSKKANRRR